MELLTACTPLLITNTRYSYLEPACPVPETALGFETAGSWLTTLDQLPTQHGLAGWPLQTNSQLNMV